MRQYFSYAAVNGTPVRYSLKNTGVAAYWDLQEASGNRADSTSSAITLDDINTVGNAQGKVETRAASFNAAASEILRAQSADKLDGLGSAAFEINGWAYLTNKAVDRTLWSKWGDAGQRSYRCYYQQSSDRFVFAVSADGTTTASVTASTFGSPSTSTWYFVRVYYDQAAIAIAINDGAANTTAHTGGAKAGTSARFKLGAAAAGGGSDFWQGRIEHVGVWSRGLASGEYNYLYRSGLGRALYY